MFGPGGPGSVGMINTWASRLKPAGIKLLVTNETQEIDLPSIGKAAIDVVGSSHYTESDREPAQQEALGRSHAHVRARSRARHGIGLGL